MGKIKLIDHFNLGLEKFSLTKIKAVKALINPIKLNPKSSVFRVESKNQTIKVQISKPILSVTITITSNSILSKARNIENPKQKLFMIITVIAGLLQQYQGN